MPYWIKKTNKQTIQNEKNTKNSLEINKKIEFITQAPNNKEKNKPKTKFFKNTLLCIRDIFRVLLNFAIFFITTLLVNYGDTRLYLILAFIVGFITERTIFVGLIKKIKNIVYNRKAHKGADIEKVA